MRRFSVILVVLFLLLSVVFAGRKLKLNWRWRNAPTCFLKLLLFKTA